MRQLFSSLSTSFGTWVWLILALILFGGAVLALTLGHQVIANAVGSFNSIDGRAPMTSLLVIAIFVYAIILAIPFMPGIELGVALLLLRGADIAPFVYLATVSGLMLAFLIGRYVPLVRVERLLLRLRLPRAAACVAEIRTTPLEGRLASYRSHLPRWLQWFAVDYRYVSLGLLLNVPGTFAIGGGGGILLAAGFSRLFGQWAVLLTLMVATLPVPLAVWLMGTQVLSG